MKPINRLEGALKAVEGLREDARGWELPVSDELQDPGGMNMALITDAILKKGWEPDGFIQKEGYRIYLYKRMV
ncbi:MAG TPA: hypothetical protein VLB09_01010 [Nitrospiria bacterium]|nr:hypothetical protein [Nitrospiria bacterium]